MAGENSPETQYPGHTHAVENSRAAELLIILAAAGLSTLLILLVILLAGFTQASPLSIVGVPLALGLSGIVAIVKPRWIFYGYISLSMTFPTELDALFLDTGLMRIYPQDVLFLFLSGLTLVQLVAGKLTFHQIAFNRYMLIYLALGLWATFVGLAITGNDLQNVMGDFRRSFFYYLVYFFALAMTASPREIHFLKFALLAGSLAVIARGLIQIATGAFVTRRIGDAAHIMNHFEVTFSMFAIFYGITKLSLNGRASWWWIVPVVAGGVVVILGNFRTCWIGMLAGIVIMTTLLPRRQQLKMLVAMVLFCGFAAITVSLFWNYPVMETQSTVGENIAQKANWRGASSDTNINWRIDSYRNAYHLWQTQPIIGRGLGEELEFYTATSTGTSMLATGHRVHNSYLWLLMSLGVMGFAVFLALHGTFLNTVLRHLRKGHLNQDSRTTTIASLSFYSAIMVAALFDVYLESTPPVNVISITMALCLLTIRYSGHSPKKPYPAIPA